VNTKFTINHFSDWGPAGVKLLQFWWQNCLKGKIVAIAASFYSLYWNYKQYCIVFESYVR